MTKQIKVTIDALGNPKVEAIGFTGSECGDATAPIERVLAGGEGGVTRVIKDEWFQYGEEEQTDQVEIKQW
jgi:hypothetical protein